MTDSSVTDFPSQCIRTEAPVTLQTIERMTKLARLIHAVMGFVTEAGELMDQLKSHIFYGKPLDQFNLIEEVGDSQWYFGLFCQIMNVTPESVQNTVIQKLIARYPEKFTTEAALNRDLLGERKVIEDTSKEVLQTPVEQLLREVLDGKEGFLKDTAEEPKVGPEDILGKYLLYNADSGEPVDEGKYLVLRLDNGNDPRQGYCSRMGARQYKKFLAEDENRRRESDKIGQIIIALDELEPPLKRTKD